MAFITLSGTLLDPNGDLAVGDQIRFTHKSTTGETVESAVSIITINPAGTYSLPLQYGLVLVEYKDVRKQQFKNLGIATVNATNPATSIPELLNALVPVSSAELIEFQAILADCVTTQTAAENAATTAEAFAYQLTTTDLIASTATFTANTNIPTSGFSASGDEGDGNWKQNGVTGQTPSQSPAQLGDALLNDGNGNQWQLVIDGIDINVKSLGAAGDEINNDQPSISASISFAERIGGANIIFPNGSYRIESKLDVKGSNIVFISNGWNGFHDAGGVTYSARIIWYGATSGVMCEFAPTQGAGLGKLVGCGNQGVTFEARNTAGFCVVIRSHNNGRWDFHAQQATVIAVQFDVVPTLGEARDCQSNKGTITIRQIGSTGAAVFLGGDSGANYSLNSVGFDIQHQDGRGLVDSNSDNNTCPFLRVNRAAGGVGVGVIFEGGTVALESSRDNTYMYFNPGSGGLIARGTSSFAVASTNNRALHYDEQSSGPISIEASASFYYTTNKNVQVDAIVSQMTLANGLGTAKSQSESVTTESLRVFNSSSNHSVLVDGSGNEWAFGIDSATGNIRMINIAGGGGINLAESLILTSQSTAGFATAGTATILPTNPVGYLSVSINGSVKKLPYYD